jgi:hypothetical protein
VGLEALLQGVSGEVVGLIIHDHPSVASSKRRPISLSTRFPSRETEKGTSRKEGFGLVLFSEYGC